MLFSSNDKLLGCFSKMLLGDFGWISILQMGQQYFCLLCISWNEVWYVGFFIVQSLYLLVICILVKRRDIFCYFSKVKLVCQILFQYIYKYVVQLFNDEIFIKIKIEFIYL